MGATLGNQLRSIHPFFRTTPLPRPAQGNLSPLGEGLPEKRDHENAKRSSAVLEDRR